MGSGGERMGSGPEKNYCFYRLFYVILESGRERIGSRGERMGSGWRADWEQLRGKKFPGLNRPQLLEQQRHRFL